MNSLGATFWSPFFLACASAAFTVLWGSTKGWHTTALIAVALTLVFVGAAFLAAKRSTNSKAGGAGGDADALGTDSDATGGAGGRGINGTGGDGGTAKAEGKRSRARGGRGGDA